MHQIAHVGVCLSRGLKLFGREIIFEEFQPMGNGWVDYFWMKITNLKGLIAKTCHHTDDEFGITQKLMMTASDEPDL